MSKCFAVLVFLSSALRHNSLGPTVFAVIGLLSIRVEAQLQYDGAVFHRATQTGIEGSSNRDNGGALFLFLKNTGASTQTFNNAQIQINGSPLANVGGVDWSRVWLLSLAAGETTTLTIKANSAPFQESGAVNVTLQADSGASLTQSVALNTPKLRVANVIASQDMKKNYVYVRNDDSVGYTVDDLFINENVTARSRFVGGAQTIAPGALKIIEVSYDAPQAVLRPMAVRVAARRNDTQLPVVTGAPLRLTEPFLPTGTYSSNVNREETVMEDVRLAYGHELSWMPGQFPLTSSRYHKYDIRGLNDSRLDFPSTGTNQWNINQVVDPSSGQTTPLFTLPQSVQADSPNAGIYAWQIEDEPDLRVGQANRNPQAMWRLNETFWRNSAKPTYLNLAVDNTVQRYGLIADHTSIDHYMQFAPLNHGSTFLNTYNIDEALQYAKSMKSNIEPRSMWWIAQGVSPGTWNNQPADWGIDVQFWSAIAAGAKGITGFKYDAGAQMASQYASQFATQQDVVHELQMVRNLVLYGEPVDNVQHSLSPNDLAARSIVSEHALVTPVINLTGRYETGLFGSGASVSFNNLNNVGVQIAVPDWIEVEQVKELTPSGYVDVAYSIDANRVVSITLDTLRDSRVFVISELDRTAPERIGLLKFTPRDPSDPFYVPTPAGKDFLSWTEPFDNFGVKGYLVYENGVQIADVPTPAFNSFTYDPDKRYMVRAYDAAGNLGPNGGVLGYLPRGDYNEDGRVDGADLLVWQQTLGTSGSYLPADGNFNGVIDSGDLTVWRNYFGQSLPPLTAAATHVPEPSTAMLVVLTAACWISGRPVYIGVGGTRHGVVRSHLENKGKT